MHPSVLIIAVGFLFPINRLTLKIWFVRLEIEESGFDLDWVLLLRAVLDFERNRWLIVPAIIAMAVQQSINDQLRTDIVKKNLIVYSKQSIAMVRTSV